MNWSKLIIVVTVIIAIIGFILAVSNYMHLFGGEWTCIAQKCTSFVEGEDWVAQNCKTQGANGELMCEFMLDNQVFNVPLSGIEDVSKMQSCAEYVCDSYVYIRRKS